MTDQEDLRRAYDIAAATYGQTRNRRFDAFRDSVFDWFAAEVSTVSKDVIDLGAGPGHESLHLRGLGLNPLATDFSEAMVQQCLQKGLNALTMDFTQPTVAPGSFGGALMSFSLLHLPFPAAAQALHKVSELLTPQGILLILLFEGEGDGPRAEDVRKFGTGRWFTYYTPDRLRQVLPQTLEPIREWRLDIRPRPTLAIAARRSANPT